MTACALKQEQHDQVLLSGASDKMRAEASIMCWVTACSTWLDSDTPDQPLCIQLPSVKVVIHTICMTP